MTEFSSTEKTILVQYGIKKYENEEVIFEKLKSILSEKDIQRNIDTLIATQIVRRIGPEVLENNESHTELPDLPENLKSVIENL
jgi:signal recognition particle GTPase